MSTLVIVGAQWGDEAKGKLVDVLGNQADVVVRYSGGNNAGHTVVFGGQTFKFQLVPVGILHANAVAIIGSGMVVCPKTLLTELERTRKQKPDLGVLKISAGAHVVFPYHNALDQLEEAARGANKIDTTVRGIGPAYQDKVARLGIRMGEFVNPEIFKARFAEVLASKNRLLTMLGGQPLDFETLYAEYSAYAEQLKPFVCDTEILVQEAVEAGKRVMFEGAQATFLDLDSGTYPYVTSSHPVAGGACLGTGVGPRAIDSVLGVCKAYTTRVGAGPFPTEMEEDLAGPIRTLGGEFGTVTGRGRRIGWQDLVVLRHSCRVNSMSGLVVTRLDILSGMKTIKVAVGYELDGERIEYVPTNTHDYARCKPIYQELEGWEGDLRSARSLNDLPKAVQDYVQFIEAYTKTPVAILSVGPDREETIVLHPELIWAERPLAATR